MDQDAVQNQPPTQASNQVYTPQSYKPAFTKLKLFFLILVFLIGTTGGFFASQFISNSAKPYQNKTIKNPSPKLLEFLKNPVLSAWKGSVTGKIVAKKSDNLTIERDGDKLTLKINENTKIQSFDSIDPNTDSTNPLLPPEPKVIPYDTLRLGQEISSIVKVTLGVNGEAIEIKPVVINIHAKTD